MRSYSTSILRVQRFCRGHKSYIVVTLNINSFFKLSSAGRLSRVLIADIKSSENPERAEETRKLCAPIKTNLFPA